MFSLDIVDVANPAAPVRLGRLPLWHEQYGDGGEIDVSDPAVSDPVDPVMLPTMPFPSQAAAGATGGHIELVGDLAYVTVSNAGLGGLAVHRMNPSAGPGSTRRPRPGVSGRSSWLVRATNATGGSDWAIVVTTV